MLIEERLGLALYIMDSSGDEDDDLPVILNEKPYPNIQKNELDQISLTGYFLGVLFGVCFAALPYSPFKRFNFYLMSLSVFHLLEFWITAKYNPGKVNTNSFLINNGWGYFAAHSTAIIETTVELWGVPNLKRNLDSKPVALLVFLGILLIFVGQYVRSAAMMTAGQSFSHVVKTTKNSDHRLVTSGIYGKLRHPSYFGFFWWSIGTQIMLLNPISLIAFVLVLWKFFNQRILYEEKFLIGFFGEEYLNYKRNVSIGIPFMD